MGGLERAPHAPRACRAPGNPLHNTLAFTVEGTPLGLGNPERSSILLLLLLLLLGMWGHLWFSNQ